MKLNLSGRSGTSLQSGWHWTCVLENEQDLNTTKDQEQQELSAHRALRQVLTRETALSSQQSWTVRAFLISTSQRRRVSLGVCDPVTGLEGPKPGSNPGGVALRPALTALHQGPRWEVRGFQ